MLQRLIAEQESTKSLLVANRALQSSVDQSEGHLKAARVRCETLQSHISVMQSHYQHLEGHLARVTDCLQRQHDGNGDPVDVAALVSQVWTHRKQLIDLEGVYQSGMQGRTSLEVQLSTLRKVGLVKDTKIMELKNKQRVMQRRMEACECELKRLRGGH
jgi:hypothetical protein